MSLWIPLIATLATLAADPADPLARHEYEQTHMGMPFRITLYAPDKATANKAADAAYQRIAKLDNVLSDYKPDSELSALSRTAGSGRAIALSNDLWTVLDEANRLARRSEGAFDVTVGPMIKLWRRARRMKEMPSPERLAAARAAVGYEHLRLDAGNRTATLVQPEMRLDLGGIAAGYAVDEALAVLRRHGVTRAMVDSSGDIGVGDAPPGTPGWRIGVAPLDKPDGAPSRMLVLTNRAVTTSGDAFQYVEIDGRRYSHIVDPHTGLGLTTRSSVTVVAANCITADSLATAVSVLGPQAGMKLIADNAEADAIIVHREGDKTVIAESAGIAQLTEPKTEDKGTKNKRARRAP